MREHGDRADVDGVEGEAHRSRWSTASASALAAAGLAWAGLLHQGLGPPPNGLASAWFEPTGFLFDFAFIERLAQAPVAGIVLLATPPGLAFALLSVRPAPALARTAAATAFACSAILAFYGLFGSARSVWGFFDWRGSVVMLTSGALLGCAVTAPDLVRALGRLHPLAAGVLYGAVLFVVSAVIRNASGWDPALAFNISPWPAIPVLALEIGVWSWVGVLAGMTIAAASLAFVEAAPARAAGVAVGCVFPVAWFAIAFPHTGAGLLAIGLGGSVVLVALGATGGRRGAAERAVTLGLAAALVALPLVAGRAVAEGDFTVSKHVRAREIIEALADYYDVEGLYPERLDELVEFGFIDRVPTPRVGSGFWHGVGLTEPHAFDYRNLGSSYVLEFVATEWVMCSYNPPWEDELADEAGEADFDAFDDHDLELAFEDCMGVCHTSCDGRRTDCDAFCTDACEAERSERRAMAEADAADAGGEAWACPDSRPELW